MHVKYFRKVFFIEAPHCCVGSFFRMIPSSYRCIWSALYISDEFLSTVTIDTLRRSCQPILVHLICSAYAFYEGSARTLLILVRCFRADDLLPNRIF